MKNKYAQDQVNYYSAMVDMMAGILFIMIILLMGFVMQENVQKQDSPQTTIENKVDALKNSLIKKFSEYLSKKGIRNYEYLNDGSVLIPTNELFAHNRVELTKNAEKIYTVLSQALSSVLTQSDEGKQALSKGLLNKVFVEVHTPLEDTGSLLSWGRTIVFYGALLTVEKNPKMNQFVLLKNKNAHQILATEKFVNNWSTVNAHVDPNYSQKTISKALPNDYILIRFSMFYS